MKIFANVIHCEKFKLTVGHLVSHRARLFRFCWKKIHGALGTISKDFHGALFECQTSDVLSRLENFLKESIKIVPTCDSL